MTGTIGDPFWDAYFGSLAAQAAAQSMTPASAVQVAHNVAQQTSVPKDIFVTAWTCHVLLFAPDYVLSPKTPVERLVFRLGCLTLLENLCARNTNEKSDSPLFALLVQDIMDCLNQDARNECYLLLVESLLPDIVGQHAYRQHVEGQLDEKAQIVIDQAIQGWIKKYQDAAYLDPLVWSQGELEDEIQGWLHEVPKTSSFPNLRSIQVPLARPLPTALYPRVGYEDDEDEPLTEEGRALMLEYLHAELIWLTPSNLRLLLLPDDEEDDVAASQRYKEVLALLKDQAFSRPLKPNGQRIVLEVLHPKDDENDDDTASKLVQECGLTPESLPKLVEHNPLVAHECLLRILQQNDHENDKNEYLSSLVNMDLSLHVLEVVNRLATILHPEYLTLFITSCIASCETLTGHNQNRLVRLLCIFIQSLLRNRVVQRDDIYFEVQSFCVEYSRIREASGLYKSLQGSSRK